MCGLQWQNSRPFVHLSIFHFSTKIESHIVFVSLARHAHPARPRPFACYAMLGPAPSRVCVTDSADGAGARMLVILHFVTGSGTVRRTKSARKFPRSRAPGTDRIRLIIRRGVRSSVAVACVSRPLPLPGRSPVPLSGHSPLEHPPAPRRVPAGATV